MSRTQRIANIFVACLILAIIGALLSDVIPNSLWLWFERGLANRQTDLWTPLIRTPFRLWVAIVVILAALVGVILYCHTKAFSLLDEWDRFLCNDVASKKRDPVQKDGYGPFGALGTFALAQGAALTAVAKGEGRDALVLGIYAFAVIFTIVWIRQLLRAEVGGDAGPVLAFETTSHYFGRWTLGWTLFLSLIMLVLGWMGLLPNQNWRADYSSNGAIKCEALSADAKLLRSAGVSDQLMNSWISWIGERKLSSPGQRFLWIQSKSEFPGSYKPFVADVVFASRYKPQEMVAFLLKKDTPASSPTYRQIAFRLGSDGQMTNTLDVVDPNKGEWVVVLAFAIDNESSKPSPDSETIAWLSPNYGGTVP
jgi:hypothetical protein